LFVPEIIVLTTLAIAGWRVRIECDRPALAEHVAIRYVAFLAPDDETCDATVTVILDSEMPITPRTQFRVTRQGDVCLLDMAGGYGKIVLSLWQATLRLSRENGGDLLEHFLKILLAYLAFQQGGLLFHAAGLLADGEAFLFTGEGGSGKSTVVALSSGKLALNDDLVVLRPDGTGWRAYGTPFWNVDAARRDGQIAAGPVAGIYKLVQDRREYLEPITTAVGASELVANCPVVNSDPAELPAVMERCRQLAKSVQVQRLHFCKTPAFWGVVRGRSIG
jgi:hypothetical protein